MTIDPYDLSAYQYHLPQELIAQWPAYPRDSSRLMVVNRTTGNISETVFHELPHFLQKGDSLVFNDTKVIPARLIGRKSTGRTIEIFLVKDLGNSTWEALAKPAKKVPKGTHIAFGPDFAGTVIEERDSGQRVLQFEYHGDFLQQLEKHGCTPLPPYIKSPRNEAGDQEDYQTVYAKNPGALAAPTAGLHFTDSLLSQLKAKGIKQTHVTLHVGLGTFRPVTAQDIRQHQMHSETIAINEEAATALNNRKKGSLQVCVGTTCCRVLESAVTEEGIIYPGVRETSIFLYPGYTFKYVNCLLTNFHLPGSTLLMLVAAFAGRELTMEAYKKAVKARFRFFSYGDAMLIL